MSLKFTSDIDLNSIVKVVNSPLPTASTDVATKAYVDSAVEGLAWKDSVRVATQANISIATPGATIDGITMVSGDRVLVRANTAASENGIYLWTGAATALTRSADCDTAAELEQAITTVEEGTSAASSFRQTTINFTLGSGSVTWTAFGTAASAANESTAGIAEIATQGETDTGTDDQRFVTPLKLATWSGRIRKHVAQIGDGASTQYNITHNFGTRAVNVQIRRVAAPYDEILTDNEANTINVVRINFEVAPSNNQYEVTILA